MIVHGGVGGRAENHSVQCKRVCVEDFIPVTSTIEIWETYHPTNSQGV